MSTTPDAIVVGSGPNGLAAAIMLARSGMRTLLREGQSTLGGGLRSTELTLPGFVHDVCSAVHPLALSSPFFRSLPLAQFGLEWIQPEAPLVHPLDGGKAAVLEQSLEATARGLETGGREWVNLHGVFARAWDELAADVLTSPLHLPRKPVLMARFGVQALLPATLLARRLRGPAGRALFAGNAAHSFLALDAPGTAAFGLLLGAAAHAVGWPIVRGGSQRFADALLAYFRSLGGEVQADAPATSLDELASARVVMLDLGPRQFARIAGDRLPAGYRRALERIHTEAKTLAITPELLQWLHATIQEGSGDAGQWKQVDNEIIELREGAPPLVRFRPVKVAETPAAIEELCLIYRHALNQSLAPPLVAVAALVFDFLCIHPFRDGNGRISRLLTLLALYQQGYEVGRYVSLERLIEESRAEYYEALHRSSEGWHEGRHDLLPWLNFFLTILKRAYRELDRLPA